MIEVELTEEELTLSQDDEYVSLSKAQWNTLVQFVRTHPTDTHGWVNRITEDGTLTGKHKCSCHNIA